MKSDVPGLLLTPGLIAVFTVIGGVGSLFGRITGLDRHGRFAHRCNQIFAKIAIWLSPIRLHINGYEHLGGGPYVVVSNHQSVIDNLIALAILPFQFRFFGKRKYFRKMPAMYFARYIPMDSDRPSESRERLINTGTDYLQRGISMIVFPEGTRSVDGTLREFKSGAFELAVNANEPVLPLAISGATDAMPRGSMRVRPTDIKIQFLPAIQPQSYDNNPKLLASEVRRQIEAELES